jgi:hypothetical protein
MFEKILETQGFILENEMWYHPKFPWITCTGTRTDKTAAIRGFMNKPRTVRDEESAIEAIERYKVCPDLTRQYTFAVATLTEICDELNSHYPNAEFSYVTGNNGVPLLQVRYPRSNLTSNFSNYNKFMSFMHRTRAKNFSMSYVELVEAYMAEQPAVTTPFVKSTADTINIFADIKCLRNIDLWKLRNVSEVKVHKIVATFPTCPPLLASEFADTMSQTYVEFICPRKG